MRSSPGFIRRRARLPQRLPARNASAIFPGARGAASFAVSRWRCRRHRMDTVPRRCSGCAGGLRGEPLAQIFRHAETKLSAPLAVEHEWPAKHAGHANARKIAESHLVKGIE